MCLENYFTQLPNRYNDIDNLICVVAMPCESFITGTPTVAYSYKYKQSFPESYTTIIDYFSPFIQMVITPLFQVYSEENNSSNAPLIYQAPAQNPSKWIKINAQIMQNTAQKKYLVASLWRVNFPNIHYLPKYPKLKISINEAYRFCPKFAGIFHQAIKSKIARLLVFFTKQQKQILALAHCYTKEKIAEKIGVVVNTLKEYTKGMTKVLNEATGINFYSLKEWSLFFNRLGLLVA